MISWPLNSEGPLPDEIITGEYLRELFLEIAPKVWKSSPSDIRRAFKALAKKSSDTRLETVLRGLIGSARDEALLKFVFNTNTIRKKFKLADVRYNTVRAIKSPGFAESIWVLGFRNSANKNTRDIANWFDDISVPNQNKSGARYIYGETLSNAFSSRELPCSIEDVSITRAVLVFASLLEADAKKTLLHTAIDLGVRIPNCCLDKDNWTETYNEEDRAEEGENKLPRYTLILIEAPKLPEMSKEVKKKVEQFQRACDRNTAIATRARAVYATNLETIVQSSDSEFERAVNLLHDWRKQYAVLNESQSEIEKHIELRKNEITSIVGIDLDFDKSSLSPETIAELELGAWAASLYQAKIPAYKQWRRALVEPVTLNRLLELPEIDAKLSAESSAWNSFSDALTKSIPGFTEKEIESWLPTLSAEEILHLSNRGAVIAGSALRSLLIAYGIERHGSNFAELAAVNLLAHMSSVDRRISLRFLQGSSTKFDGSKSFKRYVCREHFANVLINGSLALISDISVGITNTEIVGRNIVLLVETLISNLDIVTDTNDIQKSLDLVKRASDNAAAKAAITFINTPAGMSGHFRRLRESAREKLLLPLIRGDGLSIRMARELIQSIANGSAENEIFEDAVRSLAHSDKIESQHRTQLSRYLQTSSKYLEAAVRAEATKVDTRTLDFVDRISTALDGMSETGLPGTIEWLEAEILILLRQGKGPTSFDVSLTGDERNLAVRKWTSEDEHIRDKSLNAAVFYQTYVPTLWQVICSLLAYGSETYEQIADRLIVNQDFAGALKLALELAVRTGSHRSLRKKVEEAASPHLRDARTRLELLEQTHIKDILLQTEAYKPLREALSELRVSDTYAFISLLEAEVAEKKEQAVRDAAAMQERIECAEMAARLSRAGHSVTSDQFDLNSLRLQWATVLETDKTRRRHLLAAKVVVEPISSKIPEFAPLLPAVVELHDRVEDPDWWLSEENSLELTDYLAVATQRLTSWVEVVGILPSETLRTLSSLIAVYVAFIYDQTVALRTASSRTEVETILETVIEFDSAIAARESPAACLDALFQSGFTPEVIHSISAHHTPTLQVQGRRLSEDFSKSVANAITAKAWQELRLLAINARTYMSEDEAHRVDDVADFAQFMLLLSDGMTVDADGILDGAARAICTSGHPIHRAFSNRERLAIICDIVNFAIKISNGKTEKVEVGFAWSELILAKPQMFRIGDTDASLPLTRVLSALFSSAYSYELADLVWMGATKSHDAAVLRADLLCYLSDQGQAESIVRLCLKYDSTIKGKIEQMLELRAAATTRPDLIPVAEALGGQISASTKLAPVRQFLKRLPTATTTTQGALRVILQDELVVRSAPFSQQQMEISVTVIPEAVVPTNLQVQILAEDDVTFAGRSGRLMMLTDELIYVPKDLSIRITLGESWDDRLKNSENASFRLRFTARTVTESIVSFDLDVAVTRSNLGTEFRLIDNESLLEFYPGVGNTPAVGEDFVGRSDSLEQLHNFLVASRQPSPVLLTGMRRVGKTSLLQEFHRLHRKPGSSQVITLYLSIAELRHQFLSKDSTVSSTLYRAIGRALSKRDYSLKDHNRELGLKLKAFVGGDRASMRAVVQDSFESDSLSDSLMMLSEKVIDVLNSNSSRLVILLDEAESLMVPYHQGGEKKVELEQLLQSLREISQTSDRFGIVISGSNHITAFTREYKNAFFGSCVNIELEGITSVQDAAKLISPLRIRPFVQFAPEAITHAIELCAGMPQFMWQLGAATVYAVRGGKALRADVRNAVKALVDGDHTRLPFKSYDVLEPIEHMLSLQGDRERDLLWLLLRRVALTSSLTTLHAPRHFLIESNLLELDSRPSWNRRLQVLVDLKILVVEASNSYRFKVPLFAEGFRASKSEYESQLRLRRLAI